MRCAAGLGLLGLWLLSLPALGEPITRAEALRRAVRPNPQVAAAAAEVAKAEALRGQADALRFPEVTLYGAFGPSQRAELVPGTAVQSTRSIFDTDWGDLTVTIGGRLELLQPLYTFGKIGLRREAARHGIEARRAQQAMTQAEVALEVARLYEGQLLARDMLRFAEEVEHTLQRSIADTRARMEEGVGDVSELDLLRLETAVSAARVVKNQAAAGLAQAGAGLVAYLGLPAGTQLEPAEPELMALGVEPSPLEALIAEALAGRPEMVALAQGITAHQRLAAAEWAGVLPDRFAMAFLSGAYTPGRDFVNTRFVVDPLHHLIPGVIVGLRWQLQGDMPAQRANEARAEASRLAGLEAWAKAGIPAEVTRSFRDVTRARRDLPELAAGVQKGRQWVVRAAADYEVGFGDSRSVSDAVEAYALLRGGELEARYRLNVALAELAHATGNLAGGASALYPGEERDEP